MGKRRIRVMSKDFKVYLVGGAIRDKLLGLPVKDRDYCVIAPSYEDMREFLINEMNIHIHVEKPEYLTIRGKSQELGDVDFVLGRKDGNYSDARRPDSVSVASCIEEDLARRDATINAMAMELGSDKIIDPFNGIHHIEERLIVAVGNPRDRIKEDCLRILRYFRLSITKDFAIQFELADCMDDIELVANLKKISKERIRDELLRAFQASSYFSMLLLETMPNLRYQLFVGRDNIWLKPTLESR